MRFESPFDNQLNAIIGPMIKDVVKKNKLEGVDVHTDKTVVCMEGGQAIKRCMRPTRLTVPLGVPLLQDPLSRHAQSPRCTDSLVETSSSALCL